MKQLPDPAEFLLKWKGDVLSVTLTLDHPRKGRAAFRTNLGRAQVRRREIIAETERGEVPLARAWTDIAMTETGPGVFKVDIPLDEVGVFSGKACFFPDGSNVPEWPDGDNLHVKVEPNDLRRNCSIYTVFPRQFGSFREVARRLPLIMDKMGFKIIQTLPPFPVPTTYAVMGEYGCPFAATDFYSVDPAMAEFDEFATPLDQFRELIDCVHSRRGLFFVDLPANHTGWASALQTHHPDWFNHEADGRFHSPGAWGVKWADLVELDYSNPELRAYMADVFIFWCRNGVDGFRCDAGYMIPADTWKYIVARVREEYPDTVFMLEGLGGELRVTDSLLADSNLNWAYSEIFQTYDRGQFEWYLPGAIARSEKFGTLVHFAETHDNDRLAKGGETYARLRVQLAALLSWQGAWGIANGVEWYCREKIDVHGKNDLYWGNPSNMIELIAQLNHTLDTHPAFCGASHLELITRGDGNTLAVKRTGENGEEVLVLANLDCHNPVIIDWDHAKFAAQGPVELGPGEVRMLEGTHSAERTQYPAPCIKRQAPSTKHQAPLFHIVYPRNVKRIAVAPEGQCVEISAPYHFRVDIVSPKSGKTIRGGRSIPAPTTNHESRTTDHIFRFLAPHYHGDGTRCRELLVKMTVYEPGRPKRVVSKLFVPPRSKDAKVCLGMTPEQLRANPCNRAILSNGAGAASQVRAGWGEIASQYDAMLAANPSPDVPSDRVNVWARTRCWLQREGYTRQLDRRCETGFNVDPAGKGVEWHFQVPCGMGRSASFNFELTLAEGRNAARLRVTRYVVEDEQDVGDQVRIVFRPDIEWRSYHATTKAYLNDVQKHFHESCRPVADGVEFFPYNGKFSLRVRNGVYHHEPQWEYNVAHAEEAARGQDGSGDLFSPGWISADLKPGESMEIIGDCAILGTTNRQSPAANHEPRTTYIWGIENFSSVQTLPFDEAMRRAIELYIVRRDNLKTVIAGYPWFLDWGRDTFIFMRGMIAAGRIADSLKILKAFASFEENGTLPNIIYGKTAGNRDTTDAPLWFIRCVQEISSSEKSNSNSSLQLLLKTCNSIVDNYIKGTPNGIKMDPESGLVWSPSHFTWMDTNYPACTPREGYPVEIQALWISALKFLGRDELAAKATESVKKYFRFRSSPSTSTSTSTFDCGYADCLNAPRGVSAAEATPDFAIRPNQLFLITLGVLEDTAILRATEQLLIPGGIRSLNSDHPLYRGVYAGDENTSRKPAYHNGTVWAWPFPLYAEALVKTRSCTNETALQLLASAVENINTGCIGHLSENADGDAPHAQKGCTAQAWSDSEFLRVWLRLGGR